MCGKKRLENGPGMAGRRKYFDIFLVLMSCIQGCYVFLSLVVW